jgi:hypothetical protein
MIQSGLKFKIATPKVFGEKRNLNNHLELLRIWFKKDEEAT